MLNGCVTWSPCACNYDMLRRAHHSFPTRCIGWRKNIRADHPIFYSGTLITTGCESIEATSRRRRILFAAFVARMEDTSLPKCVIFVKLVEGTGCAGGVRERADGVFRQRLKSFRHQRPPVDHYSPGRGGMSQDSGIRGGTFHGEMDCCRESQD